MQPSAMIGRLYQPRNPLFWLMVGLNLMSSVCMGIVHARQPEGLVLALLLAFALCDALLGMWIAFRLARVPAIGVAAPSRSTPPDP